jgi:hypothetical protein
MFSDYAGNEDADPRQKAGRIAARLRIDLGPISKALEKEYRNPDPPEALQRFAAYSDDAVLLDLVDATLIENVSKKNANSLEQLLVNAGSAWRVADDRRSLERRVDPTATEALRAVAQGNAAPHLAAAWNAAYGRHPQPSRAYSEAIKAVEGAGIPVVLPGRTGAKATLGRVIQQLSDHSQDWRLAISTPAPGAGITPLVDMLRLLWQGQTDRHGGSEPTAPVSAEAAEAAVHLAITLVQWFQSGAVRRSGNL